MDKNGIFGNLFFRLFEKKIKNIYWTDGKLNQEDLIKEAIYKVISDNKLDQEPFNLRAIYLFGSLVRNRYKEEIIDIGDIDIYVWLKTNQVGTLKETLTFTQKLQNEFSSRLSFLKKPIQVLIANGSIMEKSISGLTIHNPEKQLYVLYERKY